MRPHSRPRALAAAFGRSLRALQVLLACLLLGTGLGAPAARPVAPMVMAPAAESVGRGATRQRPAARPVSLRRLAQRPGGRAWSRTGQAAVSGRRATAQRAPARRIYLLRHALLR